MIRDELTAKDNDRAEASDFAGVARAYLIVRGHDRCEVVEVPPQGEAVIGRGAGSTVLIEDARVSRRHARIHWDRSNLLVDDLGGRNGTVFNGEILEGTTRDVRAGDCIRIAGREIVVAIVVPEAKRADGSKDIARRPEPVSLVTDTLEGVVVGDPGMSRVFGFARRVARTATTVLIHGETGVGKEVVAQQIHAWSTRAAGRFIRVNCAALPEPLVESELFGHERGAFTGAEKRKIGFAEAAHEGTLFLDEIGELPLPIQAKLLAMLENRSVVRVGSTTETPVDVRVISATHRDLSQEVLEGRFREDLYYRVGVVVIRVPPLRERPSEIALLANLFAKRFGRQVGWPEPVIAPDASAALAAHPWPGNIRELRNALEHAMLLTEDGTIQRMHLPETLTSRETGPVPSRGSGPASARPGGVRAALAAVERASIEEALRVEGGNRTRAAQQLGISLRSLLYKIEKYGIRR
jgi:two-component system, NtrC family, response regulator AtoC